MILSHSQILFRLFDFIQMFECSGLDKNIRKNEQKTYHFASHLLMRMYVGERGKCAEKFHIWNVIGETICETPKFPWDDHDLSQYLSSSLVLSQDERVVDCRVIIIVWWEIWQRRMMWSTKITHFPKWMTSMSERRKEKISRERIERNWSSHNEEIHF